MKYPVKLQEDIDGGFTAEIEELNGCMTQAETAGEVLELIEDARRLWIEAAWDEGHEIPLPADMQKYTGKFLVRIPKSLHKNLVYRAKEEGVSLNQYVTVLLAAGVNRNIDSSKPDEVRKPALIAEDTPSYTASKLKRK